MTRMFVAASITALALVATRADAHVSVASGPAFANTTQKITFSVGHGCNGADTIKIRVAIPAGVTSVRALTSDFGKPSVEKDAQNAITAVVWAKPDADVQTDDFGYYELTLRARVPDVAFTQLQFNVDQTCRDKDGVETTVSWSHAPGDTTGEPAPLVKVVPSRQAGWNKVVIGAGKTVAAADIPTYFADALIVWRGTSAYSANPNTMAMINNTTGVTALAADLVAGDEIWVRY